ncbi:MAG: hypothetical protein RR055_07840 [Oscillospiraceae bacterium]
MTVIGRNKFLAELEKLLAGMTERDRAEVLAKYSASFDTAESEEELLSRLGSPIRAAISELRGYAPSEEPELENDAPEAEAAPDGLVPPEPVPEALADDAREPEPISDAEPEADAEPPREPELVAPEDFPDIEALLDSVPEDDSVTEDEPSALPAVREIAVAAAETEILLPEPEPYSEPERREKPRTVGWRVALYVLFGVIVCLPAALLLTVAALAILALGAALCVSGVFVITLGFGGITVFSDVMLLCGAGLCVAVLGVPVIFLAVWFFLRCVIGFVNLVLRGGESWCAERTEDDL